MTHIGVQMYSLRNYIPKVGLEAALDTVRSCGFDCIEPICDDYGLGYDAVHKLFDKYGLRAYSAHIPHNIVCNLEELKRFCICFGIQTAVIPYIEKEIFYSEEKFGAILHTAIENAQKLGLQLAYHNHNFEFEQQDALADLPKRYPPLLLQPDIFWLKDSGRDPLQFLRENAKNVALVHVKEYADSAASPNPIVGEGTVNAQQVLQFVKEQRHTSVVLEYENPCSDDVTYLQKSIRAIRTYLQ